MYLKHPGIDSDLVAETIARSRAFFNLPLAQKNKLAWSDKFSNRGYVGVGRERLDDSKLGDLKEAYNIGLELDKWLEENGYFSVESNIVMIAKSHVSCSQEDQDKNLALIEWLEDLEDIDAVYHNMELQ